MRTFVTILAALLAVQAGAQQLHSFRELYDIMDKSQLQYDILNLKRPVADTSKPAPVSLDTRVTETASGIEVGTFTRGAQAEGLLEKLEEAYRIKKADQVRALCQQLLALDPDDPRVQAYLAQSYYWEGDYANAASSSRKAIDAGYYNWLARLILGQSLQKQAGEDQQQRQAALRELALALALNRDAAEIEYGLSSACKEFGLDYGTWKFLPQCAVSKYKRSVYVQTRREWLPYAVTKAVWAYEPGYREKMEGGKAEGMTTAEEREALLNLAAQQMDKNEEVADPGIKALMRAVDAKMLEEFVIFEIWLPRQPSLACGLPRQTLDRVADYVLKIRTGGKEK